MRQQRAQELESLALLEPASPGATPGSHVLGILDKPWSAEQECGPPTANVPLLTE